MVGKVLTKPQTIEFSKSNPFNQISRISEQKIQWNGNSRHKIFEKFSKPFDVILGCFPLREKNWKEWEFPVRNLWTFGIYLPLKTSRILNGNFRSNGKRHRSFIKLRTESEAQEDQFIKNRNVECIWQSTNFSSHLPTAWTHCPLLSVQMLSLRLAPVSHPRRKE